MCLTIESESAPPEYYQRLCIRRRRGPLTASGSEGQCVCPSCARRGARSWTRGGYPFARQRRAHPLQYPRPPASLRPARWRSSLAARRPRSPMPCFFFFLLLLSRFQLLPPPGPPLSSFQRCRLRRLLRCAATTEQRNAPSQAYTPKLTSPSSCSGSGSSGTPQTLRRAPRAPSPGPRSRAR